MKKKEKVTLCLAPGPTMFDERTVRLARLLEQHGFDARTSGVWKDSLQLPLLKNQFDLLTCPTVVYPCFQKDLVLPKFIHPSLLAGLITKKGQKGEVKTPYANVTVPQNAEEGVPATADEFFDWGRKGVFLIPSPERMLEVILRQFSDDDFENQVILITAGPTVEDIDPVRFISNRSSGKMGTALARAAARRGATVYLVHGPMTAPIPPCQNIFPFPVRSALEMHATVMKLQEDCDIAILCAAVADFQPIEFTPFKIKKGDSDIFDLKMKRTPDILASLGKLQKRPFLVGFAAETNDVEQNAQAKLFGKHCDLLCANDISNPKCGFGVDTNALTVYDKDGTATAIPNATKEQVADRLLSLIAQKRQG